MPITASYDGSGKENDHPIITVAGYFADDKVCEDIETNWSRATGGKPFHFTDFGKQSCQLGSLSWSIEERSLFLKRLASIINREDVQIISHSVEVAPYKAFMKTSEFSDISGPAYSLMSLWCVYATEALLRRNGMQMEKVAHVFETGERAHELLHSLVEMESDGRNAIRSHHFMTKDTVLLQPADLIAGVVQRLLNLSWNESRCLDNGRHLTPIASLENAYSKYALAKEVIPSRPTAYRSVVNKMAFDYFERLNKDFLMRFPEILNKRRKSRANQGKNRRSKNEIQS